MISLETSLFISELMYFSRLVSPTRRFGRSGGGGGRGKWRRSPSPFRGMPARRDSPTRKRSPSPKRAKVLSYFLPSICLFMFFCITISFSFSLIF
jgi:hypothetical protein